LLYSTLGNILEFLLLVQLQLGFNDGATRIHRENVVG